MTNGKSVEAYSREIQHAVGQISYRAEQQADALGRAAKESYVDLGLLYRIQNFRDQIVFGRRGTGKTHLLLQLEDFAVREKALVCYIDCRSLGSGIFEAALPVEKQGEIFFRSLLSKAHAFILGELTRLEIPTKEAKDKAFDHLNRMVTSIGNNSFTEYCAALEDCLEALNESRLFLVIDEWIAIPQEIQPYVASLIRKIFTPSKKIAIKIGSVVFQSQFGKPLAGGGTLGFEIGADIFPDVDLDELLVYDKEKEIVGNHFARILYRHLSINLALTESDPKGWVIKTFFSNNSAFEELVRACEGVPRDFLIIFSQAYFLCLPSSERMGIPMIRRAAHSYFLRDKFKNIQADPVLDKFLMAVVNKAIGEKRARAFMVESNLSDHPLIRRLFDHRLIHLLRRGYSDGKSPGTRFDMFTIDYGTYVDLINTQKEPQIEFNFVENSKMEPDDAVPFNDMRKIRYIKLDDAFFAEFSRRGTLV